MNLVTNAFEVRLENGSRFSFYLPATSDATSQWQSDSMTIDLQGNGERILVIDDEPQQLNGADHMLEKPAYKSSFANSGGEGVEIALAEKFDLILIDMIMTPGIGRFEVYKKIIGRKRTVSNYC